MELRELIPIDATVLATWQILIPTESEAFFTIGSTLTIIPLETDGYNEQWFVSYRCSV